MQYECFNDNMLWLHCQGFLEMVLYKYMITVLILHYMACSGQQGACMEKALHLCFALLNSLFVADLCSCRE